LNFGIGILDLFGIWVLGFGISIRAYILRNVEILIGGPHEKG
jgi:hypothetical protein